MEEVRAAEAATSATKEVPASENAEQGAIRKSQLVNWYLEEIAGDTLQSEAELIECKVLVERIIDRLVKKVDVFSTGG